MAQMERDIERRLVQTVKQMGGLCLKWVCPGWAGVPDRIILFPGGVIAFAETKRPQGGRVGKLQRWWRSRLMDMGFWFFYIWDYMDIDELRQTMTAVMQK